MWAGRAASPTSCGSDGGAGRGGTRTPEARRDRAGPPRRRNGRGGGLPGGGGGVGGWVGGGEGGHARGGGEVIRGSLPVRGPQEGLAGGRRWGLGAPPADAIAPHRACGLGGYHRAPACQE